MKLVRGARVGFCDHAERCFGALFEDLEAVGIGVFTENEADSAIATPGNGGGKL